MTPTQEQIAALVKRLRASQDLYERAGVDGVEGVLQAKEAADILEALSQTGAVRQWQPIETAPKDTMRTILLHSPEGAQLGFWCERLSVWLTCEGKNLWADPTHWMPIPEAPQ